MSAGSDQPAVNSVADISAWLQTLAPLSLSEPWDNTGLLLGDAGAPVGSIQTCLTLTPSSVDEAIAKKANLVVAHHPLPFKALSRITTHSVPGRLLWNLARQGVSVYCPHTAWDSASMGINALLAHKLGLQHCSAILPSPEPMNASLGAGRIGTFDKPTTLEQLVNRLSQEIPACRPRGVDTQRAISRVAIACGSGGSLLPHAMELGCDLFLTGEATFHTCLEAETAGVSLLMIGHYASERFAMEYLASELAAAFPHILVWASEKECDPVRNLQPK